MAYYEKRNITHPTDWKLAEKLYSFKKEIKEFIKEELENSKKELMEFYEERI